MLQVDSTIDKVNFISKTVSAAVEERCKCGFGVNNIITAGIECVFELTSHVFPAANIIAYRAIINGTFASPIDCQNIKNSMTDWFNAPTTALIYNGLILPFQPQCDLRFLTGIGGIPLCQ